MPIHEEPGEPRRVHPNGQAPPAGKGTPQTRSDGAWPFVTHLRYFQNGRHVVWQARQVRRGLRRRLAALEAGPRPFWRTEAYNWWMGLTFALGSFLFMLGSALSLAPSSWLNLPQAGINVVFFAGSIPFTVAAYLQLFQAANAPEIPTLGADPAGIAASLPVAAIGWRPGSPGWLSSFAQFLGTIQFNFNTFDAIVAPDQWYVQDVVVWTPGVVGSVLFLVSGYLAFVETCGGYWRWRPHDLDWQIVTSNLLGCVFFMTASSLAFVPKGPEAQWIPALANLHLLLGAFGFLVGALLSMRESREARGD